MPAGRRLAMSRSGVITIVAVLSLYHSKRALMRVPVARYMHYQEAMCQT